MKKTNSNNWDMVYKKCNHNRYSKFNGVKNPVELKSNFANLLKNCYIAIIAFLIIALVLLIYTFQSNPMIIVYCLIFLAGLFVSISSHKKRRPFSLACWHKSSKASFPLPK